MNTRFHGNRARNSFLLIETGKSLKKLVFLAVFGSILAVKLGKNLSSTAAT